MAILLSLRIDVGMDPYLPPSLHQMILGPTSVLTQTQFHNRRNRLGDGQELHPKSVDLDDFFTTRRLLGWVHSLDRLQVGEHRSDGIRMRWSESLFTRGSYQSSISSYLFHRSLKQNWRHGWSSGSRILFP